MKKSYLIFVLLLCANPLRAQQQPPKPNIIFILCDDLGIGDIGVFYQNQLRSKDDKSIPFQLTPYIDSIAARGAKLTANYANAPVCAPSRASLMSGVNQGLSNVRDNQFDKALEDNYNMANTLRTVGYKTAIVGKWGLQGTQKGWPAHPLNRGFDYFYGYMRHSDGHEHYPKEGLYRGHKEVWENRKEVSEGLDKCYTTDLWTAAAKKWIVDQTKKSKQPFFMYLAFDAPHAVLELPSREYPSGGGLNGGMQWLGKPGEMINTASGKIDSWVQPEYAEKPWPETFKRYATATGRIDRAVGDIIKLLKDLKIDNNTIVVFSSDNGPSIESYLPEGYAPNYPTFFKSYGPFDGIKRDCWEGGIRMPSLIQWPAKIKAGTVVNEPSIFSDWAATFLDAAGVPAPARFSGVSLLPSLTGKGKQNKSLVYIEYAVQGNTPDFKDFEPSRRGAKRNQMQAIRIGDLTGVRYNIKSASDDFEIYNVVADPKQAINLAGKPEMAGLQQHFKDLALQSRRPDSAASRPYDKEPVPAVAVKPKFKGIHWDIFRSGTVWLPKISGERPLQKGNVSGLDKVPGTGTGEIIYLTGYIDVPDDGDYTFFISAEEAAILKIHDTPIIDADYGYTKGTEARAVIRLKKGLHPFSLTVKNKSKKFGCQLSWKTPVVEKQQIPSPVFYRD